uniref:Uncharacterized protein n=1 Tax=Arundo donax TaxID=35708 RepID=A0A0A9B9T7_ARUDO
MIVTKFLGRQVRGTQCATCKRFHNMGTRLFRTPGMGTTFLGR